MHTGYDNYWMCNSQTTVPNLQGNGSLSDCTSLTSFTHIQDGRETSHSNDFISTQKDFSQDMTSQNILSYPQKTSQYDWTSMAAQSSIPYNYKSMDVRIQQKDSPVYWKNLSQQHTGSRNNVAQQLNYSNICQKTQLLDERFNQSTTQVGRIRVRDVNSLNSEAQSSVVSNCTLERQYDKYLNCRYDVDQRQRNPAQNNNVEHSQYLSSLLQVNSFRPLLQNPPTATPKPTMPQNWFGNAYLKPSEQTSPGDQYHLNNITRNEPYRTSNAFLQELLGAVNQVGIRRPPGAPRNVQTMNSRLNAPPNNATKDSNLTLSRLLEGNYNSGRPSYRNSSAYAESDQREKVTPVSQGNAFEPISPPPVEKEMNSGESSIRVTAVISLPEWCNDRLVLNKVSVPCNGDCNSMSVTESGKESENPKIPNYDPPIVVIDAPNDCLKVKKEPTLPSEFLPDSTTEIVIQTMKTEDFGEQNESVSRNSEKFPDKTPGEADTVTNNSNNNNNNNSNNDNDDQILDKSKIDTPDQTPAEKFPVRVESKDGRSKESSNTSETKLELAESNYKSKINRDKLDMLIEFLNGSDRHAVYVSEQNYSEKSNKQRKEDYSTHSKSNKSSSENCKNPVKSTPTFSSKVAKIDTTRCPSDLDTSKNDDSAKRTQIKTEKKEHNPESPAVKNQSKDIGNADKGKPKMDTKKPNPTDYVLSHPKESQENRSKKSLEPKNIDSKKSRLEKNEKLENKSVSPEDQTQVTMTKKKPESAEKNKHPEMKKLKIDANMEKSEAENSFQTNQEKVENLRASDENQNEKARVNHTTEIEKTELKLVSDPVSSIKEEVEELKKKRDHAQKNVEREGKPKGTGIYSNLKYQFCEYCVTVSPTECFWMNVVSGEVKCSNCFKNMNLDSVETNRKLSGDVEKNLEIKTKKESGDGKIQSTDRKNGTCSDSEKQTNQKVLKKNSSESSHEKKTQRRHSTGKEELWREKRKSLDENLLHERKKKRRDSEEKHGKKAQEEISETFTNMSKIHEVSECSKTDKSGRKNSSKDRSQSPKKEERPRKHSSDQSRNSLPKDEYSSQKVVRKTESNSEAGKKLTNSTEDFWPRRAQVAEGKEDKCRRKSTVILEVLKQLEKRKTKKLQHPVDREKKHAHYKKPNPNEFLGGTDLLKENKFTKVQNPSEGVQDRREKHEEKKKNQKEASRSANEHGEKKKRTINGPLQYKDFVLEKSPLFSFPDTIKRGRLTDILEDVDPAKRNRKCNEER